MRVQRSYFVKWQGQPDDHATKATVLRRTAGGADVQFSDGGVALTLTALGDGSFLVDSIHQGGASVRQHVTPVRSARGLELLVGGRSYVVHTQSELQAQLAGGRRGGRGGGVVSVSMPGRVVKVLAPEGAPVHAGQPVLIIEAMKMENEVKAPISGVVIALHAAEGTNVEAGQPLMLIGPAESAADHP